MKKIKSKKQKKKQKTEVELKEDTKLCSSKDQKKSQEVKKPSVGMMRSPNFTAEEDLPLVKAQINVSLNPICGADKTADLFWEEIQKKYVEVLSGVWEHDDIKVIFERLIRSLKNCYQKHIQDDYNKWRKYFASLSRKHPSGMTNDDLKQNVTELYEE